MLLTNVVLIISLAVFCVAWFARTQSWRLPVLWVGALAVLISVVLGYLNWRWQAGAGTVVAALFLLILLVGHARSRGAAPAKTSWVSGILFVLLAGVACSKPYRFPTSSLPPPSAGKTTGAVSDADDPYLWLEGVEDPKALAWVTAENDRTLQRLMAHPQYQAIYDDTLKNLTASDRLPSLQIIGEHAYDLLQDADHVRGLWRRTSTQSYLAGSPEWEAVLDIDALVAAEGESWVFKGATCALPENTRCMVTLSPGGSDASVFREFDLQRKRFVKDGFSLPELKALLAWESQNFLLVVAAISAEEATTSGYGRKVRRWRRGQPFAEAPVILELPVDHMTAWPVTMMDREERYSFVSDMVTIFDRKVHLLTDGQVLKELPLPPGFDFVGVHAGMVYGILKEDWNQGASSFDKGALIGFDLSSLALGEQPEAALLFEPKPNQAVQSMFGSGIFATREHLYFALMEDVVGKLVKVSRSSDGWASDFVNLPDNGAVSIVASQGKDNLVVAKYENPTVPPSLYAYDGAGTPHVIDSLEPKFDGDRYETVQHFAVSKDGTRVPYFVTKSKDLSMNGTAPALIGAYGGFGLAIPPSYMGGLLAGGAPFKSMLEAGGMYVLANIRGGGEYGPEWHNAGKLKNRQVVYDDFYAVTEDLIKRGYTSAKNLGITGNSNSGLLVGVAMTQRPDLYNAVLCGVPLLDMRRYHKLLAGASWMIEYGNPDEPEMWEVIKTYSPYHNLKAGGTYPEIFFWGSTRDDRVHPGHMRKMAARMQANGQPFLYFENIEGGHGTADLNQKAKLEALQAVYLLSKLTRDAD